MRTNRRGEAERALKDARKVRAFLLFGPDEGGSRSLVATFAAAMGEAAERIDLDGPALKADPARLADEAAAISMFGGDRWILVEQAGDESLLAVEALLDAPAAGNPVLLMAGDLKSTSKLLKRIVAADSAWALGSYPPNAAEADRFVVEAARTQGLRVEQDVARRIAEDCAGNRLSIEQELAKYALYLDASPAAPKTIGHDAVDALGAGAGEGDLSRLVDAVADGDPVLLEAEIARLRSEGQEGIALTRALLRRLVLLARLRAAIDSGRRPSDVMASEGKALFWKDKSSIERQIARWRSDRVARALSRLVEAEREVMRPGGAGLVAAEAELFAICRQAARLR